MVVVAVVDLVTAAGVV